MIAWFVRQQLDPESFNSQMVYRLFHEKGSISMDIAALLQRIQQKRDYAGQLEHVEILPEQERFV